MSRQFAFNPKLDFAIERFVDVRPGGIFSIDIAVPDGPEVPNLGCFLEVIPMEQLVRSRALTKAPRSPSISSWST